MKVPRHKARAARSGRLAPRVWASWPTERLLDLRLCDLDLQISGTILERRITQLCGELARRGLLLRPYFWLSDDWFTPSGMTGTALPFYLAHPRLVRLERQQIGVAEGSTRDWCLRLLRHEAGHAIDHAYRLTRRRKRQRLFGRSSLSYPRYYRPNPYSRRHVQHLEYWYAQSHPDEDFAETFAVWLQPRARWRQRYADWPRALRKLEYMDELMREIAGSPPVVRTRGSVESLRDLRKSLREHYRRKRGVYVTEAPNSFDRDLRRLFSDQRRRGALTATGFIRRVRPEILRAAARWTGEHGYLAEHVLSEMIARCRELKLYMRDAERSTKLDFTILLVKHTMDALYRSRTWVEM